MMLCHHIATASHNLIDTNYVKFYRVKIYFAADN